MLPHHCVQQCFMNKMDKKSIRKEFASKRKLLTKEFVTKASLEIFENLKSTKILDFDRILIYSDFSNEVETDRIIQFLLTHNREVYLPVCNTQTKTFDCVKYSKEFLTNVYGIDEPANSESLGCEQKIDCAIMPGLVFDNHGNRIGFGAGYYDKFLADNPQVYKIGLCYEFQVCDNIPSEKHDVRLDLLVTEKRLIKTE